jgi:chorismate dehydratase
MALRLGHIVYSNCFPPHAGIVTGTIPFPFEVVEGIPTELNRLLFEGRIDVSPSSSIEYARNSGRYILLPDLSITSKKEVKSIILQSRVPIGELDRKTVGLTTASATSVVLLKILLEKRYKARPDYSSFQQGQGDPFGTVDAMLFIGDHALRAGATGDYPFLYDLGELWHSFTGLPFVFALWQVNYKKNIDKELSVLYDVLMKSKEYGLAHANELAGSVSERFGLPADLLRSYWSSFSYDLKDFEKQGLLAFYGYAAEIGAIPKMTDLLFWEKR